MSESKEVKKGGALRSVVWTSLAKGVSQALTLITTIILARILSANDFGLMAMAIVYMGLVDNIIDFGFLSAIIQRKAIDKDLLSSCFWFLAVMAVLLWSITFIASPVIAGFFEEEQLISIIGALSVVFLAVPSQILSRGILARELQLDLIAKVELFTSIVRFSTAILLALENYGVWSLVYAYMVEKLMLAILLPVLARWYPSFTYDFRKVKPLLVFGTKITGSRILWYIYNRIDFIIIGRLLGAEVLGVYSIANQFAKSILQFATIAFYRVIFPLYTRLQDDTLQLKKMFLRTSVLLLTLTMPLFLGMAAVAEYMIPVVLGDGWENAIIALQVLSVVAAMQAVLGLGPQLINAVGKPGVNIYLNLFNVIIMSAGFYIGAKLSGVNGVLVAWLIIVPVQYLLVMNLISRIIELPVIEYVRHHYRSVITGVMMFLFVTLMDDFYSEWSNINKLVVSIGLGAGFYILIQFLICREIFNELKGMVYRLVKGEA